jgi:hypothetical protein
VPGNQEGFGVLFDALRQKQPLPPGVSRKAN